MNAETVVSQGQFDDAEQEKEGQEDGLDVEKRVPLAEPNHVVQWRDSKGGVSDVPTDESSPAEDDDDDDADDSFEGDDDSYDEWEEREDGHVVRGKGSHPNRQSSSTNQSGGSVTKFQPPDKVFKKFAGKINLEKYEGPSRLAGSAINPVLEQNRRADKER